MNKTITIDQYNALLLADKKFYTEVWEVKGIGQAETIVDPEAWREVFADADVQYLINKNPHCQYRIKGYKLIKVTAGSASKSGMFTTNGNGSTTISVLTGTTAPSPETFKKVGVEFDLILRKDVLQMVEDCYGRLNKEDFIQVIKHVTKRM